MPHGSREKDAFPFSTTWWSLVSPLAQSQVRGSEAALAELCRICWYPLYSFARHRGYSPHDAEDLTQGFFLHLLEHKALTQVDQLKGKFRSFLLIAFQNYISAETQRARCLKRGGAAGFVSLDMMDAEDRYVAEPADYLTPEKLFDGRWAMTLVTEVLSKLRQAYASEGKTPTFEALKVFLDPINSRTPPSYEEAASRIQVSTGTVKTLIHRLRKRFTALLREEVGRTVSDPAEIDNEIHALCDALIAVQIPQPTGHEAADQDTFDVLHTRRGSGAGDEPPLPAPLEPAFMPQRYLVARADERVKLGVPFTLTARISTENLPSAPGHGGDAVTSDVTGKLKISIYAPGFTSNDGTQREINVPATGNSSWAPFELVAMKEGVQSIEVLAWKNSVQVGGVTISIGVGTERLGDGSVQSGIDIREPEQGEYTLEVVFESDLNRYRFQLRSDTGENWPSMYSDPLEGTQQAAYLDVMSSLNTQARNANKLSEFAQSEWLKGMGATLKSDRLRTRPKPTPIAPVLDLEVRGGCRWNAEKIERPAHLRKPENKNRIGNGLLPYAGALVADSN
jgi:RNA polymerase sigma-70 factor (ECF subfamily)